MSLDSHRKLKPMTRVIDQGPQKTKQTIPILQFKNKDQTKFQTKQNKKIFKNAKITHLGHSQGKRGNVDLNNRCDSPEKMTHRSQDSKPTIKNHHRKTQIFENQQQSKREGSQSYKKIQHFQRNKQFLKSIGYSTDMRVPCQIFSDKMEEKKANYMNKMLSLRRELESSKSKQCRISRRKIQAKIMGEELKRKREKDMFEKEEKKGNSILLSLLKSDQQVLNTGEEIKKFGFSQQLAILVIAIHECSDKLLSLFVLNDDNRYEHTFMPNSSNENNAVCRICQQRREYHTKEIDWQQLARLQQSAKQNINYISQKNYGWYFELKKDLSQQMPNLLLAEDKKQEEGFKYDLNTCSICCQNFEKSDMVHINQNLHEICITCMSKYLKQQILNLRVEHLECPHCQQSLTSQIIKQYVSKIIYEKYQIFSRNIQIQNNPNLKWCPNPKCSIVISITKQKNKIKCPKCNTMVCTKCNQEAHPKISCDEAFKNVLKNLQNASDIQKCRKCKSLVEKVQGCNHMTCRVCKYEWCWLCGSTYSDIHFSPLNPLGCAGMQNLDRPALGKCRVYFGRVLMILGFLILLPIVIPFIMMCSGPVLVYNFLSKKMRSCNSVIYLRNFIVGLVSFLIGIVINPFIWVGATIYFTPTICSAITNWFERRRSMIQESQKQIKRKLISEGEGVVVSQ